MNKKSLIKGLIIFTLVLFASSTYAEHYLSSGSKTASAVIKSSGGFLVGIMVSTDGTNSVTMNVYDNTTGSGTKLIPTWVVTTSSTDRTQYLQLPGEVSFGNGCYVTVSTSGSVAYVVYYR